MSEPGLPDLPDLPKYEGPSMWISKLDPTPGYEPAVEMTYVDEEGNQTKRREREAYRPAEVASKRLRAIPTSKRLLTIVCTNKGRHVFGVVVRRDDMDTLLLGVETAVPRGSGESQILQPCLCRLAHLLDLEAVWVAVDRDRGRRSKRSVDVGRLTTTL